MRILARVAPALLAEDQKEPRRNAPICGKDGPHRKEGKRTTPVMGRLCDPCALTVDSRKSSLRFLTNEWLRTGRRGRIAKIARGVLLETGDSSARSAPSQVTLLYDNSSGVILRGNSIVDFKGPANAKKRTPLLSGAKVEVGRTAKCRVAVV